MIRTYAPFMNRGYVGWAGLRAAFRIGFLSSVACALWVDSTLDGATAGPGPQRGTSPMTPAQRANLPVTPQDGAWEKGRVEIRDTAEADVVVRLGDIDNFGFGWPIGFSPMRGARGRARSPVLRANEEDFGGTDIGLIGTGAVESVRSRNDPEAESRLAVASPFTLTFTPPLTKITGALVQMHITGFQSAVSGSRFVVRVNGELASGLAEILNHVTIAPGDAGVVSYHLPESLLASLEEGWCVIEIDDPTSGVVAEFAVDFIRLLLNPRSLANRGGIRGKIVHRARGPLAGILVTVQGRDYTTDAGGWFTAEALAAGRTVVIVSHPTFGTTVRECDILSGRTSTMTLLLPR